MVPRRADAGRQECILSRAPVAEAAPGWGWLQKAKTRLYTLLQVRRDFRLSPSPVVLMGRVYGRPSPPAVAVLREAGLAGGKFWRRKALEVLATAGRREWGEEGRGQAALDELVREGVLEEDEENDTYEFVGDEEKGGGGGGGMIDGTANSEAAVQDLVGHFQTLIWFTYRQDFPVIEPTQFTSDVGWGCMLRTGQMMIANVLQRLILGPDWRLGSSSELEMAAHRSLLGLFADRPGPAYPYSIHNIAHLGTLFKKPVGEWFGPTVIANVLKLLVRKYSHAGLTFYLAQERVIYRENVNLLCRSTPPHEVSSPRLPVDSPLLTSQTTQLADGGWRPVVVVACVRLGIDVVLNPVYVERIAELFEFPQMAGIVGGKPNASLFFVGVQDEQVLYLDPHAVQPSVADMGPDWTDVSSFHTSQLQKMSCREMDPCLAVAFCCATAAEFDDLCSRLSEIERKHPSSHVISIAERDPDYAGAKKGYGEDPLAHLVFGD